VKNRLHVQFILKVPIHSLEALELENYHHEGLASLQILGLVTHFQKGSWQKCNGTVSKSKQYRYTEQRRA
jgi:hypothetical protein